MKFDHRSDCLSPCSLLCFSLLFIVLVLSVSVLVIEIVVPDDRIPTRPTTVQIIIASKQQAARARVVDYCDRHACLAGFMIGAGNTLTVAWITTTKGHEEHEGFAP